MKRRTFIKKATLGTAAAGMVPFSLKAMQNDATVIPDVVWIENGEPEQLINAALYEMGGIEKYIKQGDVVVIKPNIGWDRAPQFAANTNTLLIKELSRLCFSAGAKQVKIFDRSCNNERRCYHNSQIEETASDTGADVIHIRPNKFVQHKIKNGRIIKEWPIYGEYFEADKIINVPVAKHHSLSRVSLGLKNLMGVMGGNRGVLHSDFDQKLIDIDADILPTMTIIDAYRVLTGNGPGGGNLSDVSLRKSLILSTCTVTADLAGLDLFGLHLNQVGHLKEALSRKLNKFDPQSYNLKKIQLA
jgi:uncharacterized protein (DUF362 family)